MNEDLKNRVDNSAKFYDNKILDIDYKQAELCYNSFRQYFKTGRGLEMGPSTGYMTKSLINDFETLHVVEGAKALLDQIPDYDNLVKHHALFEEFNPEVKFDTVVMNHVLEHIEQPVELLKRIKSWMNDDGVLIIGVPNAMSFHRMAAVHMGMLDDEHQLNSRDHELGHFRVYDMEILKDHVEQSGLKVKESGGVLLKFLSNSQIQQFMNNDIVEAYFEIGKSFAENCAEIFVICHQE